MSPEDVLDAYVNDVAKRLPRAKRNDVALELRALLREELQNRADVAGRPADDAMALDLVRGFGAPEDVAQRYRTPSFVIVTPTQTASFAALAFGGIALQWLVSIPQSVSLESGRVLTTLGAWWLSYGLGAFWWPGFMIVASIIAGWIRHTWPPGANSWRPRAADSDTISRPLWALGAAGAACGFAALFGSFWVIENIAPAPVREAFEFAPGFLPIGGALTALLWSAGAVLFAVVYNEGRWRPLTRGLSLSSNIAWVALLAWCIAGAQIFRDPDANEITDAALALVVLFVLIDIGVTLHCLLRRPQTPASFASAGRS
jgi:hypothetical protein